MSEQELKSRREALATLGTIAGGAAIGATGLGTGCATDESDAYGDTESFLTDAAVPEPLFKQIDHVVVVMMENRSFDHYFGSYSLLEGRTDVNGLKPHMFNLDSAGKKIFPFHKKNFFTIGDIDHEWDGCRIQWGKGKNDGFVKAHEADLARLKTGKPHFCGKLCADPVDPMAFYTRTEIPTSYALADEYAISDNWFCSVMGPTWPNRFFLHAGTANGRQKNSPIWKKDIKTVWDVLKESGLDVKNFYCDAPWAAGAFLGSSKFGLVGNVFEKDEVVAESFERRARNGNLPAFSVIDPAFNPLGDGIGWDDHPPHDVRLGQAFINLVYQMVAKSPKWDRTLLIVTYDEHGSFYDHVPPPRVSDLHADFQQLGFRVPTLIIGPHIRKRHVSHVLADHVSVLSTLRKRWPKEIHASWLKWLPQFDELKSPVARVRNTKTVADCFDAALLKAPRKPAFIPPQVVSESAAMGMIKRGNGHADFKDFLKNKLLPDSMLPGMADPKKYLATFLELCVKHGAAKVVS